MTTDYRFIPVAAPTGRITVEPRHALAVAWGLASDRHLWRYRPPKYNPLSLPEVPKGDLLQNARAAIPVDEGGWDYLPDVAEVRPGVYRWTPWIKRNDRFIEIDVKTGCLTWDSGTGEPSTFIGGVLIAAAQGMGAIAPGVVTMRKVAALEAR